MVTENGLMYPIIINTNGYILDGHHRFKICQELGIEPATTVQEFKNENGELRFTVQEFVITINLNRRKLNDFQKAELGIKLAIPARTSSGVRV